MENGSCLAWQQLEQTSIVSCFYGTNFLISNFIFNYEENFML